MFGVMRGCDDAGLDQTHEPIGKDIRWNPLGRFEKFGEAAFPTNKIPRGSL